MVSVTSALRTAGIWLALGVVVCVAAAGVVHLPIQVTLVLLGALAALILYSRTRVMAFVIILIPTLGLIRRLVAGESGRTESDPLILLPIMLVVMVLAVSLTNPRSDPGKSSLRFLAAMVALGVGTTVVLRGAFGVEGLFFAASIIVPMMLAITLSTGRLTSLWSATAKVLPALAISVGTYGIFQFFVLPEWDRAWMRASELTSIGHPLPSQVRVFAASESPGPFALFLGLVLTLCLVAAVVEERTSRRFGWIALGAYITYPLLLSGVRSALLSVGICAIILTLVRARGFSRMLLLAFLGGAYYMLNSVVARFGAGSTILSADRYSSFSAEDDSFVARMKLLASVGNPLQYIVGNPNGRAADNLFIDTLFRYGLVPALALFLFMICITAAAIVNLKRKHAEAASLCMVYITASSFFGPTFNSLFGILAGLVFGTVMTAIRTRPPKAEPTAPTDYDRALKLWGGRPERVIPSLIPSKSAAQQ